jgi:hypothetical protein
VKSISFEFFIAVPEKSLSGGGETDVEITPRRKPRR